MENYNDQQVARDNNQRSFGFRLQIVMSFIKRLINDFKITRQDLIDAGVYFRGMDD
jgi:hypothetical protein